MFTARVESDAGEVLNVQHPHGTSGGNLILSFVSALEEYCAGQDDSSEFTGFEKLQMPAKNRLCELAEIFSKVTYSGDWNYTEDEFAFFLKRVGDYPVTEESFRASLRHANEAWLDIEHVIDGVNQLVVFIKDADLEESWWYVPTSTLDDFQALHNTLQLLKQRGAEQIRINID